MFGKTEKKENVPETKNVAESKNLQEVKPSPFDEMDKVFDQFMKNRWLHPFSWRMPEMERIGFHSGVRVPTVDIVEKDNDIVVRAEIPGVDKKDIDITLNGSNLTIQGKSKRESQEETDKYHRCEISTSSFSRTLILPADVDADKVKATFENGVLEVSMPKTEVTKRNKISVE